MTAVFSDRFAKVFAVVPVPGRRPCMRYAAHGARRGRSCCCGRRRPRPAARRHDRARSAPAAGHAAIPRSARRARADARGPRARAGARRRGLAVRSPRRHRELPRLISPVLQRPRQAGRAHAILSRQVRDHARLHVGLGEHDQALTSLERAYQERSTVLAYLRIDPSLAPLHALPRFQALVKRLGGE